MRRMLVAMVLLSAPVSAQNTNCQLFGNSVNCQTTQPSRGIDWSLATPPPIDTSESMRDAQEAQRNAFQRRRLERSDAVDQQSRVVAQRAGELAAAGRCDEAKAFALRQGEFQIARDVESVCAK